MYTLFLSLGKQAAHGHDQDHVDRIFLRDYFVRRQVQNAFCPSRNVDGVRRATIRREWWARHLDGDKKNNRIGNLAWGTQAENMQDMIRHGRTTRGERSGTAKLTNDAVRKMKKRLREGAMVKTVAAEFGITEKHASRINTGNRWGWLA